jgi:hypothetical protein
MGKKNKKVSRGAQQRERWNYIEKKMETVPGTKAGRKRSRLPIGHPLRTHDLRGPIVDKRGKKIKAKV